MGQRTSTIIALAVFFVNPVPIELVMGHNAAAIAWPFHAGVQLLAGTLFAALLVFHLPGRWISSNGGLDAAIRETFGAAAAWLITKLVVPVWAFLFIGIFGEAFAQWAPFGESADAFLVLLLWATLCAFAGLSSRSIPFCLAIFLLLTVWMMWAHGLDGIGWGRAIVPWSQHYLLDAAWIHASLPALLVIPAARTSWRMTTAAVVAPLLWTAASILPIAANEAKSTGAHSFVVSYGAIALSDAGPLRPIVTMALIAGLLPPVCTASRIFADAWIGDRRGRIVLIAFAVASATIVWRWNPSLAQHAAAPFPAIAGVLCACLATRSRGTFDERQRRVATGAALVGLAANLLPDLLSSANLAQPAKSPVAVLTGWSVAFAGLFAFRIYRSRGRDFMAR